MKSWHDRAQRVIAKAIEAGEAAKEPWPMILKRIDAAYPFGERKYHPYKQWLKARKQVIMQHENPPPPKDPDWFLKSPLGAAMRESGLI